VADGVRAYVDVREYGALKPGAPVALGPGESSCSTTFHSSGPFKRMGRWRTKLVRFRKRRTESISSSGFAPVETLAFDAVNIPRIRVSVPATIRAEIPFDWTTTPAVDHVGWSTDLRMRQTAPWTWDWKANSNQNILTLLESPCEADLAFIPKRTGTWRSSIR